MRGRTIAAAIVAACALGVAAAPAGASAHEVEFAINAAPYPKKLDPPRMRHAGIARARFGLNWTLVQGSRHGAFDWTFYDKEVARLARSKITALPILIATPHWIARNPLHPPTTSRAGRQGWRRFVAAAAGRYGSHGAFWKAHSKLPYRPAKAWQVWNEPNYPASWRPRPAPRDYVRLLKITRRAVRSADRHGKIVLAGLGPGRGGGGKYTSAGFLTHVYRAGGGHLFDVAALNVYAASATGDEKQIKAFSHAIRGHTPLWVTEAGWSSGQGSRAHLGRRVREARKPAACMVSSAGPSATIAATTSRRSSGSTGRTCPARSPR